MILQIEDIQKKDDINYTSYNYNIVRQWLNINNIKNNLPNIDISQLNNAIKMGVKYNEYYWVELRK